MARRTPTRLDRLAMRRHDEPFDPQPGDYVDAVARLMQDRRTTSGQGILVQHVGDRVLACWDLPRPYRPRPHGEDAEYPSMSVVLRGKISDGYRLTVDFYSVADQEVDLAIEYNEEDDSVDAAEVDAHARYVREAFGCPDDEIVLSGLDARDGDSAVRLKDALARFGIDLYAPARSLKEALESTP